MLRNIVVGLAAILLVLSSAACAPASTDEEELSARVSFFVEKAQACDFESDLLEPSEYSDSVYFDWSLFDFKVHKTMTFSEYMERRDEVRADVETRIERELTIMERECG